MLEWLGEEFGPTALDMDEINEEFFKNFKKKLEERDDLDFGGMYFFIQTLFSDKYP